MIGHSKIDTELERLTSLTFAQESTPISKAEYAARIEKAQGLMQEQGIDALYLNAGTNLYYFTGTRWYASERMVGALLPANGSLVYISPFFEISTLKQFMAIEGDVKGWQEHECPYQLTADILRGLGIQKGTIAIDESSSFFISNGIRNAAPDHTYVDGKSITATCRMIKSDHEIALMQAAKNITLEVQKSAAAILHEGITTTEVASFINQAHIAAGAPKGNYFVIVLFGEATAYPHGVKDPQTLKKNDMVLIDTGCQVHDYISDITRSYVYGTPSDKQRSVWNHEKQAQKIAFNAAQLDTPCGIVDVAARDYLASVGYGPDYQVPGLPHRTGHGIGLDIHEWPYLVRSDQTPLKKGMCFSNEPMLCLYGEFGVRLEDHFYMTDQGPKWFTQPSPSIDQPF